MSTEVSPLNVILMPLRDDWPSATELIRRIDRVLIRQPRVFRVLVVDDGSVTTADSTTFESSYAALRGVRVLRLRCNLGHQRAIAIGLAYLEGTTPCDSVLVMDSDGEDTPEGVEKLLEAFAAKDGAEAIFAERSRRSESLPFRIFYRAYKLTHRCLTGFSVRVGNFSILPGAYLTTLAVVSETWNHYAAAVFRSRLPYSMVPIARGYRIAGSSRMNFAGLVGHGLSAISVFGDIVGVRLLIASLAGALISGLGVVVVVSIRFLTDLAIPGWATNAAGLLAIIAIQLIAIATTFTFYVLSGRSGMSFIPRRDYEMFVAETTDFYCHE